MTADCGGDSCHQAAQAITAAEVVRSALDGLPYITFFGAPAWCQVGVVERVGHIFHDAGTSQYPCLDMDKS